MNCSYVLARGTYHLAMIPVLVRTLRENKYVDRK